MLILRPRHATWGGNTPGHVRLGHSSEGRVMRAILRILLTAAAVTASPGPGWGAVLTAAGVQ
ncbi:MAG: hypothetical protein M0Z28_23790 [Rhodospirillales bacterium]|nr:hypothetical protein [Rhodospirillales bacterium]